MTPRGNCLKNSKRQHQLCLEYAITFDKQQKISVEDKKIIISVEEFEINLNAELNSW